MITNEPLDGRFYALINAWLAFDGASNQPSSLLLLAVAFFVTKCCDYSIRGVVTEMIYVPLDFDSRFVGKEVNGVFGNRLGKSGMSVLLSVLTAGGGVGLPQLTQMAAVASLAWTTCAMWLSRLVANDAHATRPPVTQERDSTRDEAKED
ncbi:TLC ATP/ADP transporter [Fragilaria crotonensis]|nr:TLC ATP/ADP transporter [Fragilaria crotonensis]